MDRDKIRIIDFGTGGGRAPRPAPTAGMKIIEFDHEPGGGRTQGTATGDAGRIEKRMEGRIRILEFDEDPPGARREGRPAPARTASTPRVRVGAIKIREFDEEGETRPRDPGGRASKIKIMEFD